MLSYHVKEMALEFISKGNWYSDFLGRRISFSEENEILLKWLIQNERLGKNELEEAIHKGLCVTGRTAYLWTRRDPLLNRPDHSLAPDAIGWALMHKAITYEEALIMKFDHGETIESYIKSAYDLLDWAVAEFRKPYVPFIFEPSKSLDEVDACCAHD
jgi:hypothetical protein